MIIGGWNHAVAIAENNFVYKSLSEWACNIAVGCRHSCLWCYVPSVSTNKLKPQLANLGVADPDAEWGQYVFVREWDDNKFRQSLKAAETKPRTELKADGNRAVFFCSTTDPYQVLPGGDGADLLTIMEESLKMILNESSLNVRILTRGPLARKHFPLMQKFGNRLMFGMSIPTLRNDVAKIYEPDAPSPTKRMETMDLARAAGLNTYVAMAPTYPECDAADLRNTMAEFKRLGVLTVFSEPINIRSKNVARIKAHAESIGAKVNTEVFKDSEAWGAYAKGQLLEVERIGKELGLPIHLWPDKSMAKFCSQTWLDKWWKRISEWPK